MHSFLWQNVLMFSDTYCLQGESVHVVLRVSKHFGLEVLRQFATENGERKISNIVSNF